MQANNVNSSSSFSATANQPQKLNQLSQDDFIKILLAQMKLQTPEKPFDSNTMMQQMSQLTNLSATKEMEKTVKNLNANIGSSQVLAASQLVGKKIQVANELSPLVAGEGLKGSVVVPQDVDHITVTIKDMNQRVIKTLDLGASSSGVVDFSWDGMDAENHAVASGFYHISAHSPINGEDIALSTAGTFTVNSVALDKNGNGVLLNLDGIGGVNMKDIIKIL